MARPARALAFRSALVAVFTLFAGLHLSGRQTPVPDRQQQPPPPPATGLIVGQVLDAAAGKPVPGAIVSLSGAALALAAAGLTNFAEVLEGTSAGPAVPNRIVADAEGRFVFRNLPKGRYAFTATASGYLPGNHGQRRAGGPGTTLELETGEKLLDATIRLWKAGTITGTITDETGEPLVGLTVRSLRRGITAGRMRWTQYLTASTDDRGVYRMAGLAPGDYSVAVMSTTSTLPVATVEAYREAVMAGTGNTSALLGELRASGAPMPLLSGFRVGDLMVQPGSPLGRSAATPPPTETGKLLAYPTTYHPAVTTASQMTVISLGSGEERAGVDVHLRLVPTVSVSGTVRGADGPVANIGVRLVPTSIDDFATETGLETADTATDATGAFMFLGVPSGAYTAKVIKTPRPVPPVSPTESSMVMVSGGGVTIGTSVGPTSLPPAPLPTEPTLWASQPVSVGDADVTGVNLTLRTGARLTGQVEFKGTRNPPAPEQIQRMSVTLQPLDIRMSGAVTPGRVTPDQQFRTPGYPPGRYLLSAGGLGTDWTFRAALVGGRDVSDEPLEIGGEDIGGIVLVFTDRPSQLTGTVRNAQNQADPDADVVVFPANHQRWKEAVTPRRSRSVRASKTGVYTIQNLPPGEYFVVAISSTSTREWQDPKSLEAASSLATRVTILEGDKKTQDLRTSRLR